MLQSLKSEKQDRSWKFACKRAHRPEAVWMAAHCLCCRGGRLQLPDACHVYSRPRWMCVFICNTCMHTERRREREREIYIYIYTHAHACLYIMYMCVCVCERERIAHDGAWGLAMSMKADCVDTATFGWGQSFSRNGLQMCLPSANLCKHFFAVWERYQ